MTTMSNRVSFEQATRLINSGYDIFISYSARFADDDKMIIPMDTALIAQNIVDDIEEAFDNMEYNAACTRCKANGNIEVIIDFVYNHMHYSTTLTYKPKMNLVW